jgi:predicted dehydrogenase
VNWLFNSSVESFIVSAKKMIRPTIDDVSVRLTLRNGAQVTINNSRITPQIIRNYRSVSDKEVIYLNTATLEGEILRPSAEDPFHTVEKIQLAKQDALALETDHFVQAVKGNKKPAITGREAALALRQVEDFVSKAEAQF